MTVTYNDLRSLIRPGGMYSADDLIKALANVLNDSQMTQLAAALASTGAGQIRPGNLISADLVNQLLKAVSDLQARVANLESASTGAQKPVIINVSPNPVSVRDTLTVSGVNFPSDPDLDKVDIAGTMIKSFSTATEKQLVFSVPALSASLPADLTLTIRNGEFSDSGTVRILPEQIQVTGRVSVQNKTQSLPTILEGQNYNVDFEIDSITNIAESYGVKAVYTELTGTATENDWLSNTTILDTGSTGNPSVSELRVQPGKPGQIRVNFKVPQGATSAKLQLQASSISNPNNIDLNKTSNPPLELKIGQAVTPSDPNTTFKLKGYGPAVKNARIVQIDGKDGVEIQFSQTQFVRVDATFTLKGTYDYSHKISPDSTGWTIPSTGTNLSPANSIEQAGSGETIAVSVTSIDTNTPQRTLEIKAVRRADTEGPSRVSWIEIPIRGFQ